MIEIAIVTAIIGILAALSIAVLSKFTNSAREIGAKHDLGQFVRLQIIYHNENNVYDEGLLASFEKRLTKGVVIEVYGAGPTPLDTTDDDDHPAYDGAEIAYAEAYHEKSASRIFKYVFETQQWSERT